jgi:hypothetical protein
MFGAIAGTSFREGAEGNSLWHGSYPIWGRDVREDDSSARGYRFRYGGMTLGSSR